MGRQDVLSDEPSWKREGCVKIMKPTRTDWDWHWTRLKNTLYNGRWKNDIAAVFKKKLDKALDKGYPIDYIPINTRVGNYNLLLYTMNLLSASTSGIGERLANLLLDKGADVNVPSRRGETALIILVANFVANAGKNYSDNFWMRIISQTKDIDAKDYRGYSALDYLGIRYVNTFNTPQDLELKKSNIPYYIFSRINMLLDNGADPGRSIQAVRDYARGVCLGSQDIHKAAAEEVVTYITTYMEQKEQVNSHQMCCYDYEL